MTSREAHVAAVARGDDDAKAGADATVSEEETPAAPQCTHKAPNARLPRDGEIS